jgi:hypothetical protein
LDAAFLTRTKPGTLLTTLPVTAAFLAEFFRGMGMVVAKGSVELHSDILPTSRMPAQSGDSVQPG